MREIIGENMSNIFIALGINPKETFSGSIGYWSNFKIWELTDAEFAELRDLTDEQFERWSEEGAWWRSSEGSIMGVPDYNFVINGHHILAWYDYDRDEDFANEFWLDVQHGDETDADGNLERYIADLHTTEYKTLLEYFCAELGASTERNVCALAVDLARYNNMTMAELFRKYNSTYHNEKTSEEKRNLYFQRSNGQHRLLATDVTEKEASKEMQKFMDDHNFKSYYTRSWEKDGAKWYDVGSWSEFFIWTNELIKDGE